MPYVFPNADIFIGLVLVIIVGLVVARMVAVRKRRARVGRGEEPD